MTKGLEKRRLPIRLIDAEALLEEFENKEADLREPFGNYAILGFSRDMAKAMVQRQPTIEAAPVLHGRWEDKPTGRYGQQQSWCSACRKPNGIGGIEKNRHRAYCPNCGARMNGDGKVTTTPTAGSNHRVCKHCNTAVIGMEEYAECPECGHPFEEVANG